MYFDAVSSAVWKTWKSMGYLLSPSTLDNTDTRLAD